MTNQNNQLTVAQKLAIAKKELNKASKAEAYFDIPLELKEIRFLKETTMMTEKGNIKLEPTRWFCVLDGEDITIETYTIACKAFAEELITILGGQAVFDDEVTSGTPIMIQFFGQVTKQHKEDGILSPAVKLV